MNMTRHTESVEVIFKDQRRRRWSLAEKSALALMARSNSPTLGHPKFPQAGPPDYDDSGATAMRAAASLRR